MEWTQPASCVSAVVFCIGCNCAASAGFLTAPVLPAGTSPVYVAVGDFNADGILDFAVANHTFGIDAVNILLGNGDGSFQPNQEYPVATGVGSLAIGDFNGDGIPDILTDSGSLLFGNGDGTFQPSRNAVGFAPGPFAVGDLNADGVLDLAVGNVSPNIVVILLGKGDGIFQTRESLPVDELPYSIAVGDFNMDGYLDIVLSNQDSNTVSIVLGNGDGTFQAARSYAAGYSPFSLSLGDFNGDGKLDIAIDNPISDTVTILLGNGDGSFQAPKVYNAAVIGELAVADLNSDGHLDLASASNGVVSVLLSNGNGTFQAPNYFAAAYGPQSFAAVGDFNGDGHPDLAVSNRDSDSMSILLGNGDGSFQAARAYPPGGLAHAVADVNGDGIPDVVITNLESGVGTVSILLGQGNGSLAPAKKYAVAPPTPVAVAVGDFNGDGVPDLAVASVNPPPSGEGTLTILLGNGDGTFQPPLSYAAGLGPRFVAVGDFNGDGKLDIVTVNFSIVGSIFHPTVLESDVRVFLGNGDGSFQPSQTFAAGSTAFGMVAVADFNGDGLPDLAVTNQELNAASILLGNGDGTFQSPKTVGVGVAASFLSVGDFNGDGIPDLAAVGEYSTQTGRVSIRLGNGDGTFRSPRYYAIDFVPIFMAAADFNRDGIPDLAVSSAGGVAVLLGDGDGSFQNAQDFPAGSAGALAVGDFNGDGFPDLALRNTVTTILINDTHWSP